MAATTKPVAKASSLWGRLLKKRVRVRMTRMIVAAETTDSRNQPVRNAVVPAWRKKGR